MAELAQRASWVNITLLGHWGPALQAKQRRLARVYQRRLCNVEHKLRQVGAGIGWPLVGVADVLGCVTAHLLR